MSKRLPPSEDGEAMCECSKDSKSSLVVKGFGVDKTGRRFGFGLPLQSIEIEETDADDVKTVDTSFSLKLKVTDREIKQPQRLSCKSSIALIPSQTLRFLSRASMLYAVQGIEQNIYRTPMRTPWRIRIFKNSQGHGNTKGEGIANASKKCRPKYIGSRWTERKRNSSRRHIA
jgi:hypothetical protein